MPAVFRARSFGALSLLLVTVLVTSLFSASSASAMTRKQRVAQGYSIASNQRGDWYQYGAAGPNRFDCSGLVYYSYRKAGFSVPRTSSAQASHAHRIAKSNLHRGDLVFFYNGSARASNVYHVAIFVGWDHGRRIVLHAPRSGERVHREAIWTSKWFAGTLR